MQAFVTGATGLLGNNLVRELVAQGHAVKALVRDRGKAARLFGDLPVTLVEGDMCAVEEFAPELEGCDALFHTAAYFREYYQPGDHWPLLEQINVRGTVELLAAAEARGVRKAVYVSSSGIVGMKPDGSPGDETTPPGPIATENLYFRSKVLAEAAVFEFLKTHHLPVVLVLPGWMFGPGDAAPTSAGQLVLDYLNRRLPVIFDGGTTVADARDVAAAMVSAWERGRNGQRYIVSGRYASLEQIFGTLERLTGVPAPRRRAPVALLLALASVSDAVARLTRTRSLIPRAGIRTLQGGDRSDSSRAIRELGATFRPLEATLRDEVAWFQKHQPEKLPRDGIKRPLPEIV